MFSYEKVYLFKSAHFNWKYPRSLADTLQFYRYFTNVEIQERLLTDAQDKIGEFIGINPKEICREVNKLGKG